MYRETGEGSLACGRRGVVKIKTFTDSSHNLMCSSNKSLNYKLEVAP